MNSILLISVQTIKDITQLHANVNDKLVQAEIDNVQNIYLLPLIGSALLNRLKEGVDDGNLTPEENGLIDNYINKVLAYYTLSEMPEGLSMQFYSTGLVNLRSNNSDNVSFNDLLTMAKTYKKKAEVYAERLISYLKANATSSLFPQYLEPGDGRDSVRPNNDGFECAIHLD